MVGVLGAVLASCAAPLVQQCQKPVGPGAPSDSLQQEGTATLRISTRPPDCDRVSLPPSAMTSEPLALDGLSPPRRLAESNAAGEAIAEGPPGAVVRASAQEEEPVPSVGAAAAPPPARLCPLNDAMTVEEALQYALEHHPLLRARRHEVEIAQARLITAGLLPNPQLVLDVESGVQNPQPTEITTRVMFTIPTGRKRRLGQAVAQAGIQRARFAVSKETEVVLTTTAETALEVLYLQELVELRGELAALMAKGAEVQRARFEARAIRYADKVVAEVDAADAELRRQDAAAQLESARIRLARAMGVHPPRPVSLQGRLGLVPIPELCLETVLAAAAQYRPEIGDAQAAVQEAQRQLALARARAKPDLAIGPRFRDVLTHDEDDMLGARITSDLPLFNRNQGGIRESAAQIRTNCALLEAAELNNLGDVAAAYLELLPLHGRLQYYQQHVLPVAERTEAIILEAYQARTFEAFQVSELQQRFAAMRLRDLEARYRFNQLLVRLELFLGRRLADLSPGAELEPVRPPPEPPETIKAPPARPR